MGQAACCKDDACEPLILQHNGPETSIAMPIPRVDCHVIKGAHLPNFPQIDSIYVVCQNNGKLVDILHVILEGHGGGEWSGMSVFGNAHLTWDGTKFQKQGSTAIWLRQHNGEFHGGNSYKMVEINEYWRQIQAGTLADEFDVGSSVGHSHLLASQRALHDSSNPYTCVVEGTPLYNALASGSLRLVRGKFLEDLWEKRQPWPLRQEMPKHALWDAEQACSHWRTYGPCFFFALSYGWLHPVKNDPDMWYLERVVRILREYRSCAWAFFVWFRKHGLVDPLATGPPEDIGYFIDFCSIPQQDQERGIVRSAEEHSLFIVGLGVMKFLYGHFATTVTRITDMPASEPREYRMRGWTSFEETISNAKPEYEYRVFTFGDMFKPGANALRDFAFFKTSLEAQTPPRLPEQFEAELQRRRDALPKCSTITLFRNHSDEALVVNQYREAWAHLRLSRSLIYRRVGWGCADIMQLASVIPEFQNLTKLVITGSDISGEGMLGLLRSVPAQLLELTITDSGAEDAVADLSAELQRLKQLQMLDLSFCKWGDDGIEALVDHMPGNIRHLELAGGSFTDRGGVALAALLHELDLQKLCIPQNPVGPRTVDALEGALPGSAIQVLMVGHGSLSHADKQRLRKAWEDSLKPDSGLQIIGV
eukprot:TRINITY_DN13791_c0_g1_i4.p1 TRINITY_DN13791_c0_g1~~TRINITY_DN13791_c0_g1_i4.p1  ORF type:complete len:649 (+),score=79.13 TRINITY_DN13791_c0_g1_i4:123-2069(+)